MLSFVPEQIEGDSHSAGWDTPDSVGEEGGRGIPLEERIGFAAITLGVYSLLCLCPPSTFIFLVVYSFISIA